MVRICIPTKDRSGNVAMAVACAAMLLGPGDELILYDDGHRPATADYGTRFALDIALQLGAEVSIKRGKPSGIANARANILADADRDQVRFLCMIDDDILVTPDAYQKMLEVFRSKPDAQYSVPIIALSNNEAGVARFGDVPDSTSVHDQQFVLGGSGIRRINGGAWTCAIIMDLSKLDVSQAITRTVNGPNVAEDYRLTNSLVGYVDRSALVWHVMSGDQGERAWNSAALQYLREQTGRNKE